MENALPAPNFLGVRQSLSSTIARHMHDVNEYYYSPLGKKKSCQLFAIPVSSRGCCACRKWPLTSVVLVMVLWFPPLS